MLLRYPFITSAFRSVADLVESGRDRVRGAAVSGPVPADLLTPAATAQTAFASSQWRLGLADVDFRDGEIDRAAFEQLKQAARSAGAALDQAYDLLDLALARLMHQPLAEHLQAILLRDGAARLGIQLLLLPAAGGALTAGDLRLRCACRHD